MITGYWLLVIGKMFFADLLYKYSLSGNNFPAAKAAKNLFPSNPFILMQAAKLAATNNLPTEALSWSRQAIQTSPGEINFYKLQSQIFTTLAITKPTYLDKAIQSLQEASLRAPTDPVLPYQLGNIYFAQNQLTVAETFYQKALSLKPNYDLAMLKLATIYVEQKKYPEAKKMLDSATRINPLNKDRVTIPQN